MLPPFSARGFVQQRLLGEAEGTGEAAPGSRASVPGPRTLLLEVANAAGAQTWCMLLYLGHALLVHGCARAANIVWVGVGVGVCRWV